MTSLREQAVALRERVRADLWGRTLPFWMRHSIDDEHGGFFNCLDEDGSVTDATKHIWLQGRQCWMLARLAALYSAEQIDAMTAQYKHEFPDDAIDGSGGSSGPGLVGAVPGMPRPPRVAVTRANLIAAAERGVDFLRRHAVQRAAGTGEIECVYFAVARDGTPVLHQRKIFSATFLIMALGEVGRVTGRAELRAEAVALLDRVLAWIDRPGALGKPALPGAPPLEPLNVPMIMLNVIDELAAGIADAAERRAFYAERRAWAVEGILKHVSPAHRSTFECVRADGSFDMSCGDGRLLNPGHAIEAGWFLIDAAGAGTASEAAAVRDPALLDRALQVVDWAFDCGWDVASRVVPGAQAAANAALMASHAQGVGAHSGGMLYFQDACGLSPSPLEWPMKLWWPQAEAMIAFAKAFAATMQPAHLERLQVVADWTYAHLVDHKRGEWFGYSDRAGKVTHRFKGGAYKGCFHVPRALLLVDLALEEAISKLDAAV